MAHSLIISVHKIYSQTKTSQKYHDSNSTIWLNLSSIHFGIFLYFFAKYFINEKAKAPPHKSKFETL